MLLFLNGTVSSQSSSCDPIKVVVLGSSTAAGTGPSSSDSAWVNKYRKHLQAINPANEVINLAVGGTTTYHIMPTGFVSPIAGRPSPNSQKNISMAISLNADAIIVNMPSNDASNFFTPAEQLYNFDSLVAAGTAAGIPVWICTTQPRNGFNSTQIQWQIDVKDSVLSRYGNNAIDFWSTIATITGSINPLYNSGDGIHLNNAGHAILFNRAEAVDIPSSLCNDSTPTDYAIEVLRPTNFSGCGDSSLNWQVIVKNTGADDSSNVTIHLSSTFIATNTTFYFLDSIITGLDQGERETLYFNTTTPLPGAYAIDAWISSVPADSNTTNDTLTYAFQVQDQPQISVFDDTICENTVAHLSAMTGIGDTILWFDDVINGNLVNGGNSFTTPPLNSTTSYYAKAVRGPVVTGDNDSIHTTSISSNNWNGTMFDLIAHQDIVLDSLAIKMFSTGSQIVDVYQKQGSYKGFESDATAWTVVRTGTIMVNNPGEFVNLDLDSLTMTAADTFGIYLKLRSHLGKLSYNTVPQEISRSNNEIEIITGTGITHGFSNSYFPRDWNGSVYYHYGSAVESSCETALTEVVAEVVASPNPNLGADTSIKIGDSTILFAGSFQSFQWSTGDTTASLQLVASELGIGMHVISLQVTNAAGCFGMDSINVLVTPALPDTTVLDSVNYSLIAFEPINPTTCGDSSLGWLVVVKNEAVTNTADVMVTFSGTHLSTNTSQFYYDTLFGGLAAAETDTLYFNSNVYSGGDFSFSSWITTSLTDTNQFNDTLTYALNLLGSPVITVFHDTVCAGSTAELTAIAGINDSLLWYDQEVNGNLINNGPSFTTPPLDSTRKYYVQASRGTVSSTSADTNGSITTTYNSTHNWNGVMFDLIAHENIVLDSLALKMFTTGTQVVDVYKKQGSYKGYESNAGAWSVIRSATIVVPASGSISFVDLDSLAMADGDTFGIYLKLQHHTGKLSYLKVNQEMNRSNNEIEIVTGTGITHGFTNSYFPRDWNGSVYYHYSIDSTTTTGSCLSDIKEVIAHVENTPTPYLGIDTTLEQGDSLHLFGGNYHSYHWSTGDTTPTLLISTTGLALGIHQYSLQVWTDNGCIGTDTINLTIVPAAIDTTVVPDSADYAISSLIPVNYSVCGDSNQSWQVIVTNENQNDGSDVIVEFKSTFLLTNAIQVERDTIINGLDSAENDTLYFSNMTNLPGNYLVETWLTTSPTDTNQLNDTLLSSFNIIGKPSITAFNDTVCKNSTALLSVIANAGDTVLWYDQAFNGNLIHTGSSYSSPPLSNNLSLYVKAKRDVCESELSEINALVLTPPSPAIGMDTTIDHGDSILLIAGTYDSYLWSTGATTASIWAHADSLGAGVHLFSITVIDTNGCSGSDSIQITVLPPKIDFAVSMIAPLNFTACGDSNLLWQVVIANEGDETSSNAVVHFSSTFLPTNTTLTFMDTLIGGLNSNQSDTLYFTSNASVSGNYNLISWLTPIPSDSNQFNDTSTYAFNITGQPNITILNDTLCEGNPAQLIAIAGTDSVEWFDQAMNGNLLHTGNTYTTPALFNHSVYYARAIRGSCSSPLKEVSAHVYALPQPNLGNDTAFLENDSITLSAGNFSFYNWSTGETSATIQVKGNDLGIGTHTIHLTVTNSHGCIGIDSIKLTIQPLTPPPSNCDSINSFKFVVLGSSTPAGIGPTNSDSVWVDRFNTYIKTLNSNNEVVNLAIGGTTSYHIMPTGFVSTIGGRPSPNTIQNITKALTHNPDGIIINMPSDDVSRGYLASEELSNYDSIVTIANAAGVTVWICTPQPKNWLSPTKLQRQKAVVDSVISKYGDFAIDFWNGLAQNNGYIIPAYGSGDGFNLNNSGHWILYNRVKDRNLISHFCEDTLVQSRSIISEEQSLKEEVFIDEELIVYPNPTRGIFTIQSNAKLMDGILLITNQLGQVVFQKNYLQNPHSSEKEQFTFDNWSAGYYILTFHKSDFTYRKKLIIRK